jgi:hypothetical protein
MATWTWETDVKIPLVRGTNTVRIRIVDIYDRTSEAVLTIRRPKDLTGRLVIDVSTVALREIVAAAGEMRETVDGTTTLRYIIEASGEEPE